MNNATPKQLSALIAFVVAFFCCIIISLINFAVLEQIFELAILFVSVFFFVFLLTNFIFGKFIHEKIRLLYKTISKTKATSNKNELKSDVFKVVNDEVQAWAKEYEEQAVEFKEKEQFRREFIGNVSHELKTPIFNIQGYVLTLLEGGLEDDKINRKYLEKVEKSVNRMIHLVNDLDAITKLEVNQLKLSLSKVNLVELAKEVIDSLETFYTEANIAIVFDKVYASPVFAKCDKEKIFQVFSNLITNSIKYGKEGGKTIIRFYAMEENILVEIADNGLGMDARHLPRLFERFYRVEESRSRNKGGTGLGLAIVKHIIDAHGQTINVRSSLDVGSTFSFTLAKA